jgi:hypothetical protein
LLCPLPSRLSTGGSDYDGNSSAANIRQRFVRYGLRFAEILPYKLQSPE